MCCSLPQCANCCIYFSMTGFIFLLCIGAMLDKQPDFIKGPDDPAKAAKGCYYGAIIYLGTCLLSGAYCFYDQKKREGAYTEWNRDQPEARALTGSSPRHGYGSTAH